VIYNQAVSVFGVNTDLLNSLGECYIQTGNTQEALLALEKSLEIEPGQERIQELVRSLKK
jgi:tetratricopeptide (TPR) repeat protein